MNVFLQEMSKEYPQDILLLICDGAMWHRSSTLNIPSNIVIMHIPPYTPEMNPIEQVWKQIRVMGFRNEVLHTLNDVVLRLCETINSLTPEMLQKITYRSWLHVNF